MSGQVIRAREKVPTSRRARGAAKPVIATKERPLTYSCAYWNENCLNDRLDGYQYCLDHIASDKMARFRPPKRKEQPEVNLSFCGCGFLGIYHVGVASCFHEYAPQLSMHKIAGSSAGALVAAAHICGNPQLAYATTDILRVAIDARARTLGPFHPSFDINATVREALERGLPDDVHLRASGKLHVSLTRVYDGENVIISEFDSKEDVIQVLLCSCFIPVWSGLRPPKYKGVTYIDGGFSDNLLTLDEKTVTVSPFAGEADICPQDDTLNLLQINLSNTSFSISPGNLYRLSHALLPPPPEVLSSLCEQGFADGIRYLQRMKLISCTKCLEIRSSLLVTANGEDMEDVVKQEVASVASSDSISLQSAASGWSEAASGKYISEQHPGEQHSIRLEHQEQKLLEINGHRRRDSVVSTTSQIFQQQQQQQQEVAQAAASANLSHLLEVGTSEMAAANTIPGHTALPVLAANKRRFKFRATEIEADEYDDEEAINRCNECVMIRQKALRKNLPKQFSDRIRDACDTVNKSLSNWIYSHRPIKYLSYLAAPYYLPIEISLALIAKCWQRLPAIRTEISECLTEIVSFLVQIVKRMQSRSTTALLMAPSSIVGGFWTEEEAEAEKKAIGQQKSKLENQHRDSRQESTRKSSLTSISSANGKSASSELASKHNQVHQVVTAAASMVEPRSAQQDQFALKITSDGLCVSRLDNKSPQVTSGAGEMAADSLATSSKRMSASSQSLHSLEDTFDSIVDAASTQEARIFAYYYRNTKDRLQVTEIFDYERAADLNSGAPTSNNNTLPHRAQQVTHFAEGNRR